MTAFTLSRATDHATFPSGRAKTEIRRLGSGPERSGTMPEMEKGRPPENKRSRKPAHPVKREINQEMKVRERKKKLATCCVGRLEDLCVRNVFVV